MKRLPTRDVFGIFDDAQNFEEFLNKGTPLQELFHVGRGHVRDSGKYKTTLLVPVSRNFPSHILFDQLQRYENIYVIDTNKLTHTQLSLHISCAAHIALEYLGKNQWNIKFTRLTTMFSTGENINPEIAACVRFIKSVSSISAKKIAIVIDSELGNIPLYNQKKIPIQGNTYLPENVELIYASADKDSSSPLNYSIRMCDADANGIKKIITEKSDLLNSVISRITNSENGYFEIKKSLNPINAPKKLQN